MITRTITITIEVPENTPLTHSELEGIRSHIDGDNIFDIINKYSECDRDEVGVSVLVNQPTESSMKVLIFVDVDDTKSVELVGVIESQSIDQMKDEYMNKMCGGDFGDDVCYDEDDDMVVVRDDETIGWFAKLSIPVLDLAQL